MQYTLLWIITIAGKLEILAQPSLFPITIISQLPELAMCVRGPQEF